MASDPLPQRSLSAVLDELIPARDASLPGAGSLGVGSYVEAQLGTVAPLIASGLATLDELAREKGAVDFATLAAEERAPLVSEAAEKHPGFVQSLIFHTYAGYYQHPRVSVAIGAHTSAHDSTAIKLPSNRPMRTSPVRAPQLTNRAPMTNSVAATCSPAYIPAKRAPPCSWFSATGSRSYS